MKAYGNLEGPEGKAVSATQGAVKAVIVSKADMMCHFDPERIQGYCRSCEKYGQYWACPPFENSPFADIPEWTHAVLVTQKTPVVSGTTQEGLIHQFMEARQILGEMLLSWEVPDTLAVVAGHCFGCMTCTRSRGVPCCMPSRMRYSLEALGFDVTGLVENLARELMHWPAGGVPDYLLIVGALLCSSHDVAMRIKRCAQVS